MRSPFRRSDTLSQATSDLAKRALVVLDQQQKAIAKKTTPQSCVQNGKVLFSEAKQMLPNLSYSGFGIYHSSSEEESIPGVWKKEIVEDPKTGAQVEWLVAYTTDDDDIGRSVASSVKLADDDNKCPDCGGKMVKKTIPRPNGKGDKGPYYQFDCPKCDKEKKASQKTADYYLGSSPRNAGDRDVNNDMAMQNLAPQALLAGTPVFDKTRGLHGSLVNDVRPGLDQKALVSFQETGKDELVPINSIESMGSQKTADTQTVIHNGMPYPPIEAGDAYLTSNGRSGGIRIVYVQWAGFRKDYPKDDFSWPNSGFLPKPNDFIVEIDRRLLPLRTFLYYYRKYTPKKTAAESKPNKTELKAPIAPGVVTKNLTIDQTGQGGTAQVNVTFSDPNVGEQFFKQVETLVGQVGGGGEKQPAAPVKEEEATPAKEAPEAPEAPETGGGNEPNPNPAGGGAQAPPMPMASSINTLTVFGQQSAIVHVEAFGSNYPDKFFYVNEEGVRVDLPWTQPSKIGSMFTRPDNQKNVRLQNYVIHKMSSDDEDMISAISKSPPHSEYTVHELKKHKDKVDEPFALAWWMKNKGYNLHDTKPKDKKKESGLNKEAVDISDRIPPLSWQNKESQNEQGEGGKGAPQPPNPALNSNAPIGADTSQQAPPLFDSSQDGNQKGRFNLQVDPSNNAVTVRFNKPDAIEDIDKAVDGQQPQLDTGVQPQPPVQPNQQNQQGQPQQQNNAPGQQKPNFENTESTIQF